MECSHTNSTKTLPIEKLIIIFYLGNLYMTCYQQNSGGKSLLHYTEEAHAQITSIGDFASLAPIWFNAKLLYSTLPSDALKKGPHLF